MSKEELTPGGYRPKTWVHPVQKGDTIALKGKMRNIQPPRNQIISKAFKDLSLANGLVLTPGGFRPPQLVHAVEKQETIGLEKLDTHTDFILTNKLTGNTRTINALTTFDLQSVVTYGSGWIVNSGWTNNTGQPVSYLSTEWIVPAEPVNRGSQVIFLFNGIQNQGNNFGILQPVLQWGISAAGGGPYWSIASWYVTSDGQAFHTPLLPVSPGDTLVGVMSYEGNTGSGFDYKCEFAGIQDTTVYVNGIAELNWCNETLEAYGITGCGNYPDAAFTAMRNIRLETMGTNPVITWLPDNRVTDCGQHCDVIDNSNVNGEIQLYYR